MQKQINLKIYGRVQGISLREMSKRKAKTLGLSGWVRNEPDGTVQVVAEGEEKKLKEMIEWCTHGYKYAKVEKVEAEWLKATNEFEKFQIN